MFKKFLAILFLSSLIIPSCSLDKPVPYGIVQLQNGLPPSKFKFGGYDNPMNAEIKSNGLFHALYFVKDTSKSEEDYFLFTFTDSNSISTTSGSMKMRDNLFYDSLTITLDDEGQHLVDLELYYDNGKNELKYHWVNSFDSNEANPGGFPQLINPKVMIGSFAPDFSVLTQDGSNVNLSSLKGKFVHIEFWGTWCGGCIMEIPNIKKLRQYYSEEDLYIIGLAAYDDQEKLTRFLNETPLNYPTALIDENVVSQYGVRSFPSSFLLDRTGKVIAKNLRGDHLIEEVKAKIDEFLLKE